MGRISTGDATLGHSAVVLEGDNSVPSWQNWLDKHFEKPFLVAGMLAMIVIIVFQTLYRYIGSAVLEESGGAVWTEELARFIFVGISYLAIPLAIKSRTNIRVDILYDRLSPRLKEISWISVDICFLLLAIFMLNLSLTQTRMQLLYPQTTSALQIPYFIPYLVLPISFSLMVIRLLQDMTLQFNKVGFNGFIVGVAFCSILTLPLIIGINNPLILLFGYFIILTIIGVPIAPSLGLAVMATILGAETMPIEYMAQVAFTSIDKFPIMAIPFFIAAGVFMGAGGLSKRLLALADEMLGSLPGGLGLATIATCMFFASISGSGPATVAAIGSLTIPAMIEQGYDKYFSAAIVAAAGAIGVMIPPSNPFVVYGVSAQVSVGKLFMAGIIPGLMTGLTLMGFCYLYSKKQGWQGVAKRRSLKSMISAVWEAKLALTVPIVVLGGIYGGLMTPTEAAAIAAFYGLFVGIFVYKEINITNFVPAVVSACSTSAIVIILMAMATLFGNVMTIEQVPNRIAATILGLTENKILILLLINLLLLWVGTFLGALAAIIILTPILMPIVLKVGVDPMHFGIVMVVNLAIGFVTPPVGVNLFVASSVAGIKMEGLSKMILPLIGLMIFILILITYIPEISQILVQ